MVATKSMMMPLEAKAINFYLPNKNLLYPSDKVSLGDFTNMPLVIAFICNHCPFVVLIEDALSETLNEFQKNGVGVVAICSNDSQKYPEDSPSKMTHFAKDNDFEFPYLYDATQEVAKAYQASCTPDFYVFDEHHKLKYRGQFDEARPGKGISATGDDLKNAVQAVLSHQPLNEPQHPSVGCNIKWKPGNEPDYIKNL